MNKAVTANLGVLTVYLFRFSREGQNDVHKLVISDSANDTQEQLNAIIRTLGGHEWHHQAVEAKELHMTGALQASVVVAAIAV